MRPNESTSKSLFLFYAVYRSLEVFDTDNGRSHAKLYEFDGGESGLWSHAPQARLTFSVRNPRTEPVCNLVQPHPTISLPLPQLPLFLKSIRIRMRRRKFPLPIFKSTGRTTDIALGESRRECRRAYRRDDGEIHRQPPAFKTFISVIGRTQGL